MDRLFKEFALNGLKLANRFVFTPIKTAFGSPHGEVTDRQLLFYQQIALNGPGIVILEPVSVTLDGKEHPRQLCIHLSDSEKELSKIVKEIHKNERKVCLHLNHAGAAANPKATGSVPKSSSIMRCPSKDQISEELTEKEIGLIIAGFRSAAKKAKNVGIDIIEIQGGHGYLLSQFLNKKLNKRLDRYGKDRLLFAKEVINAVMEGASGLPVIIRISGNEMSPEFGIDQKDLYSIIELAEQTKIAAIHVGMGNSCFSPPWYFHHSSLPEKPQMEAVSWLKSQTALPLIIAGRMGEKDKVQKILDQGLADLVAFGRPLIADPKIIEKWKNYQYDDVRYCGYCLQGCLHRLQSGNPLGCNVNPEIGKPILERTNHPRKVLIAGGGPAGMSAAYYLNKKGHQVTIAEKENHLGGQFSLAWQAPGKEKMKSGLESIKRAVNANEITILLNKICDVDLVKDIQPDLLVWATGSVQNIPEISGFNDQWAMTSLEYFNGEKEVHGQRILVIGAGRVGLEIAEKLGKAGYEVVATKRTDPIGSSMEKITRILTLKRIDNMPNVSLMPHTTVKVFKTDGVEVEKDGKKVTLGVFDTVIIASGMLCSPGPDQEIVSATTEVKILGDAHQVKDIFTAIHDGYALACTW